MGWTVISCLLASWWGGGVGALLCSPWSSWRVWGRLLAPSWRGNRAFRLERKSLEEKWMHCAPLPIGILLLRYVLCPNLQLDHRSGVANCPKRVTCVCFNWRTLYPAGPSQGQAPASIVSGAEFVLRASWERFSSTVCASHEGDLSGRAGGGVWSPAEPLHCHL